MRNPKPTTTVSQKKVSGVPGGQLSFERMDIVSFMAPLKGDPRGSTREAPTAVETEGLRTRAEARTRALIKILPTLQEVKDVHDGFQRGNK